MSQALPSRPNLDHLRKQAKALLAAFLAGDKAAADTLRAYLPAAKGATAKQLRSAGYRLADAQSAVARQSGFGSWPQLARHVEQLRALEGSWSFERLEVDGTKIPPAALGSSRLLIDGDRFRTESPEATYEGVFNIDVESEPSIIEIEFTEGPEAGNWNYGIFRLAGEMLELCLDVNGKPAPKEFRAPAGSGHACELLRRTSGARPNDVTGGKKKGRGDSAEVNSSAAATTSPSPADLAAFAYRESAMMTRLQGEWEAEFVVLDGVPLQEMMLPYGRRTTTGNEMKVVFGGQVMAHALMRIVESTAPVAVDYCNLSGRAKGAVQLGIMEWRGDSACFCIAPADAARPADFASVPGDGRTFSQWRPKR